MTFDRNNRDVYVTSLMSKARTDKKFDSIYVISGKEDSLVSAEYVKLLDALVEPEQRMTALFAADGPEVTASEVLDELRTLPFLADKRVVAVKNADKFVSENRPHLETYFDNPCPTGILILTVRNWDARTKLAKKLQKAGTLMKLTEPKSWELPPRLIKYADDAYGKKLTKDAAQLLVDLSGDSLPGLYSEIDKLAVFADAEKTITVKHIESLIGHNRLFNAFAVIDSCLAGNVRQAVERLRSMFAEDKSAEYTVVGAFAYHLRKMFNAKVMLDKGVRPDSVTNQVRIWSNKDRFITSLRKMPLKKIGDTLKQLAQTDYAIKTGQTKAQVAIEQLVLQLASK